MRKEAFPRPDRPRTVVTTDPELDDLNSMIRLLTHANEIDLRGLVYSSSRSHYRGDPATGTTPHRWPPQDAVLHIDEAINAYEQCEDTLRVHDPRYPTAAHLRSLVRTGNVAVEGDMSEPTPGSQLIADLLRRTALTPDGAVAEYPAGPDDVPPGSASADSPVSQDTPADQGAAAAEGAGPAVSGAADGTRPLFIQAWGGLNTIARALLTVEEELSGRPDWEELRSRILDRVVVTSFGEQDSTLVDYIRPHWPGLEHREVATMTWGYMTRSVLAPQDMDLVGPQWVRENVSEVGPLGAAYRVWGDGRQMAEGFDAEDYFGIPGASQQELEEQGYTVWCPVQEKGSFISEGDTPSFAPLVDNGLRSWEDASFGGWGGRQVRDPRHPGTLTSGLDTSGFADVVVEPGRSASADDATAARSAQEAGTGPTDLVPQGREGRRGRPDVCDPSDPSDPPGSERTDRGGGSEGTESSEGSEGAGGGRGVLVDDRAPDGSAPSEYHVTRWWRAAQHELAARLAWSVSPTYEEANHPPVVEVPDGLAHHVVPGQTLALTATASDPDGDRVLLRWWAYPEAGTCPLPPRLTDDGAGNVAVTVPRAAEPGQTIHLVVEATDDGVPWLTRYQRVVLTVTTAR